MNDARKTYAMLISIILKHRYSQSLLTHRNGSIDILREEDPLKLNDEEVDELVDVCQHAIEGFPVDSVILSWPYLGRESVAEENLANNFGTSGY